MSYTSNSEFDLETRVQITNEYPTIRSYQQMHHSLQNDTWKWLIGTEDVDYDLPVGGKYVTIEDADGNQVQSEVKAPPVKIVNGKQAAVYGPEIHQKWNAETEQYETETPTYHRMEIKGTLATEQDLFLHEIYRYLSCIYPDHPDWLNLLTRNEIIDAFNNAAAMVDYKPNNEFFKLVADAIDSNESDVEEFKLNLRNLTSNAARRKFYGSTLGYRMVGHDAYEDIMIFPIGKNLTLAAQDKKERQKLKADGKLDVKNYIIDTFDERYQTLFRRIDWLGEARDTSFVSSNGYNFSSYNLPGYEEFSFEFNSSKDNSYSLDTYKLYSDSLYSFYNVDFGDTSSTGSIADIKTFNILEPSFSTDIDTNEKTVNYVSSDDKLCAIQYAIKNKVEYNKLYKYKPIEEYEAFFKENEFDTEIKYFDSLYNKDGSVSASATTSFFDEYLSKIITYCSEHESLKDFSLVYDTVDFVYNPFIKNTIMLPTEQMIALYDNKTNFENYTVISKGDLSLENSPIKVGDLISFRSFVKNKDVPVYAVAGASYGQINISFNGNEDISKYQKIKSFKPFDVLDDSTISDENTSIVIKTNNQEYVELQGSLRCFFSLKKQNNISTYYLSAATFNIRAIPDTKSATLYKLLYGTDAFDLLDEINESLKDNNKKLEKARALIKQELDENLYGTPLEIYEELSVKETLSDEEKAKLDDAIAILEEHAYSYWEDYKQAESDIADDKEDLQATQEEIEKYSKNRSLLTDDSGSLTIGYDSTVTHLMTFEQTDVYSEYQFFVESGFITGISFGNVSVLPLDATQEYAKPLWRHYEGNNGYEKDYNLVQLDTTKLYRDNEYFQLYSNMYDADKALAFTPTAITKVYNEETFEISAQVYIDKEVGSTTNEMQFLSDDAKKKFDSITVGSKVSGPGISSETYVTSLSNNSLTVSTQLPNSGYYTYKFECPVTTSPEDITEDPFNYKRVMNNQGIYDKVSFFDHGVYGTSEWPNVSSVVFNGDLKDKQILNPNSFLNVVDYFYNDKLEYEDGEATNVLLPSIGKYTRDIFVDIKADKLIPLANFAGTENNLMNVEWLDYIQNNNELALAKENINVGANIILNTDTSGYASLIKDSEYTDSNLKIKFQTLNWDNNTIPAYVQIGTGGSNMKSFFKTLSDAYYPSVYGATFYDHTVEPETGAGNDENNIEDWRNVDGTNLKKRGTYAKVGGSETYQEKYLTYESIDTPLFEVPLNEYNINLKTYQNNKTYTTIDVLFYEQGFKNLTKKNNLKIAKSNELSKSFIQGYQTVSNKDFSIVAGINYYYFADGSNNDYEKGALYLTDKNQNWTQYEIVNGGCIGALVYYFNSTFYNAYSSILQDVTIDNIDKSLLNDTDKLLLALLKLKTYYYADVNNISNAYSLKNELLQGNIDNINKIDYKWFKNKLVMFTYIKGAWDDENDADIFGLNDFDLIGILDVEGESKLVHLNKNYTLCTMSNIQPLSILLQNDANLFYGYSTYNIISIYDKARIENREAAGEGWIAISNDLSEYYMNTDNSIINYTNKIYNTIQLPRKFIADGSYELNFYVDPKFVAMGYDYNSYLNGEKKEIKYIISQSAIKYDEDNDLFYTVAAYADDNDNWIETPTKVVVKFEEQKYFKDLKFLYGAYKTELTQSEGSTSTTKEAYIRSITGENFDISDLSTQDKFVYAEEIDLRSQYSSAYNNRLFQGTKQLSGEIYGVNEDGSLYISGKRSKSMNRLYDSDFTNSINAILPATVTGTTIAKENVSGIDFTEGTYASPEYVNVEIKKSIDHRYSSEDNQVEFKYYKNLLVFEGQINLKKPSVVLAPADDGSTFYNVLSKLNSGDSIEGIAALTGGQLNTKTIITNVKEKAKYFTVKDDSATIVTASGKIYSASGTNYDSVGYIEFTADGEIDGNVLNIFWDEDAETYVATIGVTEHKDNTFGYDYWEATKVVTLDGNSNEVYNTKFSQTGNDFIEREDGIYVYNKNLYTLKAEDDDEAADSYINPNDIAIRYYSDDNVEEGPYIPREPDVEAGEAITQRLFSDEDIDIALIQEYMFVKTPLYKTSSDGSYTSIMTNKKHWKAVKIPVILDYTLLHLKTMTVEGTDSAYSYVVNAFNNFCDWAFEDDIIQKNSDGSVSFAGQTLAESYTEEEVKLLRSSVQNTKDNLLSYSDFCNSAVYYNAKGNKINTDYNKYVSATAIAKVVVNTELPLDENLRIAENTEYELVGTTDNYITQSVAGNNSIDFTEMYYQYLCIALTKLIGEYTSENFGTSGIADITSTPTQVFFKTITNNIISIDKDKLYKYEDIQDINNWTVATMPVGSYIKGSYDSKLSDYNTVELYNGTKIPISSRDLNVYLYRPSTDLYVAEDNTHIFIGGYTLEYDKIQAAVETQSGTDAWKEMTSEEWFTNAVNNWLNEKGGRAPCILYSEDKGQSFNILPLRQYISSDLFSAKKNYCVSSFTEKDGKIIAVVSNIDSNAPETRQIIISLNDTHSVDSTLTEYKSVIIPETGKVYTQTVGNGSISWTDSKVGYGVDIDQSEMAGTNTFNFDYSSTSAVTLPSNLVIKSVDTNKFTLSGGIGAGKNVTGTLTVLIAVNTKNDISNPELYLTTNATTLASYMSSLTGTYKVPTVVEVSNYKTADRIYSERYISPINDDDGNMIGFPTVEEDTTKSMYEYSENDDGSIGDVVALTNTVGNEVKLCSEDGKLLLLDSEDTTFYTIEQLVKNQISTSNMKSAGKNKVSTEEALNDISSMTTLENESEFYSNIDNETKLIDFDTNDYYAEFKNNKSAEQVDTALADHIFWNISVDQTDKTEEEILTAATEELLSEDSDFIEFITTKEGYWGSLDNAYENATERFEIKLVKNENTGLYSAKIKDNKYNCYILNKRLFITGTLILSYTFYNNGQGITVIPDPSIECSDDNKMQGDGYLASGIYYHPLGYGGLRNNNSIVNTTPWDRDPKAFKDELLKNSIGHYVYLTDEYGTKIKTYNSIKIADGTESITYDDFLNDGKNKIIVNNKKQYYYKLPQTEIYQYHSAKVVKDNQTLILRAYKNATVATEYRLENTCAYDADGNELSDTQISLKGNLLTFNKVSGNDYVYIQYQAKFAENWYSLVTEFDVVGDDINTINISNVEYDAPIIYQKKSDDTFIALTSTDKEYITEDFSYYVKEKLDNEHLKTNFSGASTSYKDNKLTIKISTSIIEYNEIIVYYGNVAILYLPILTASDNIYENSNKYYLGDSELDISLSSNIISAVETIKIPDNYNVLTLGTEQKLKISAGDILIGLYGYSISKVPVYKNFADLIYYEGTLIRKCKSSTTDGVQTIENLGTDEENHYYLESQLTDMKISQVSEDGSEFKLQLLVEAFDDYNDNNEHYFMFKILTIAHQSPNATYMNNEEYFREVSVSEMSTFPPDRVWYNSKGSPLPPVQVGETIFNEENNYAYYKNDYVNANNFKIRLCDEYGHYINYDLDGNEYRLDSGDGDCSTYVFSGSDGRYISPEPVNATCQEWYKENMWVKNKDVNPLWQIIHIVPKIENKKWVQSVSLCKYVKSGNNQILSTKIDYPYISINNITKVETSDGVISYKENADMFNLESGALQLLLSEGSDYYKTDTDITMYGLHFTTENLKELYSENEFNINSTMQVSYTVNTTRDFTTQNQENNSIVQVTELGIFNKNHKLIAYANFPAVEYRTDCQHLAFTCVVYYGNMVSTN